jgi:hypothetical protein
MKNLLVVIIGFLAIPFLGVAQTDTSSVKKDSVSMISDTSKIKKDTTVVIVKTDTVAPATNCYSQWFDFMRTRGAKTVTDGNQEVVVSFKSGESCVCFMGKVEVAGGKIKPPLYIQTENGEYKLASDLGKKMDQEFVTTIGADLWTISNGMSVLFRTATQEYGRLFFYKFANKSGNSYKEAPSPSDLIKE